MKFVTCFVLFVVAAAKNIQFDAKLNEHWENFKKAFGKVYNGSEEIIRRSIWEQNVEEIAQHNLRYDLGLYSYRVGINKHSDKTHEEFVRMSNGYLGKPGLKTKASAWVPEVNVEIPDHVDWRTEGYVTPVIDQGDCGSCWAISALGTIEAQMKKKTGKLVPLSIQNLVDCSKSNKGCRGGLMTLAFEDIKKEQGIDTADSYPYIAKEGNCRFDNTSIGATITGYVEPPEGDEEALKQAVATIGPIGVAFDSSNYGFKHYKDGIYDNPRCYDITHSGLLVGYGTEDGKDYWLVKNSWGTSWGNKGYAKMSRNKNNQCSIATLAIYPLL